MTENTQVKSLQAGNTVESLKPKIPGEVSYEIKIPSFEVNDAPQNSELNSPDIDECAPIITQHVNENFQLTASEQRSIKDDGPSHSCLLGPNGEWPSQNAAQLEEKPEVIPPTNLWSLRARINDLEDRLDAFEDRVALFNVRSGQKL